MSGVLDSSGVISLTQLLTDWVENDAILRDHFMVRHSPIQGLTSTQPYLVWQGAMHYDCLERRPKLLPKHVVRALGDIVVRIFDDRVSVVFAHEEIYKFQAVHPMFFQKLRGHVYDMHNRYFNRCEEYLR